MSLIIDPKILEAIENIVRGAAEWQHPDNIERNLPGCFPLVFEWLDKEIRNGDAYRRIMAGYP